jgi:hypothetical protein
MMVAWARWRQWRRRVAAAVVAKAAEELAPGVQYNFCVLLQVGGPNTKVHACAMCARIGAEGMPHGNEASKCVRCMCVCHFLYHPMCFERSNMRIMHPMMNLSASICEYFSLLLLFCIGVFVSASLLTFCENEAAAAASQARSLI